jgi:hypothetical protein
MKNLSCTLFLVALVSMLYLVTPCNALAQSEGDIPCCYNSQFGFDQFTKGGIQSMILSTDSIGHIMAYDYPPFISSQSPANEQESQIPIQFGNRSQISFAKAMALNEFLAKDREIYCGYRT